jgi:hypothetical protein
MFGIVLAFLAVSVASSGATLPTCPADNPAARRRLNTRLTGPNHAAFRYALSGGRVGLCDTWNRRNLDDSGWTYSACRKWAQALVFDNSLRPLGVEGI